MFFLVKSLNIYMRKHLKSKKNKKNRFLFLFISYYIIICACFLESLF